MAHVTYACDAVHSKACFNCRHRDAGVSRLCHLNTAGDVFFCPSEGEGRVVYCDAVNSNLVERRGVLGSEGERVGGSYVTI